MVKHLKNKFNKLEIKTLGKINTFFRWWLCKPESIRNKMYLLLYETTPLRFYFQFPKFIFKINFVGIMSCQNLTCWDCDSNPSNTKADRKKWLFHIVDLICNFKLFFYFWWKSICILFTKLRICLFCINM